MTLKEKEQRLKELQIELDKLEEANKNSKDLFGTMATSMQATAIAAELLILNSQPCQD